MYAQYPVTGEILIPVVIGHPSDRVSIQGYILLGTVLDRGINLVIVPENGVKTMMALDWAIQHPEEGEDPDAGCLLSYLSEQEAFESLSVFEGIQTLDGAEEVHYGVLVDLEEVCVKRLQVDYTLNASRNQSECPCCQHRIWPKVCQNGNGLYYVGTWCCKCGPVSRLSHFYHKNELEAKHELVVFLEPDPVTPDYDA